MAMQETLRAALALVIGLMLGSVLPANLLARRRGVDIGTVGDGNPGTWNAFAGLGFGTGLVTLVYDVSVGIIAIWTAKALGVSEGVAYAAGIMTVVGHRFPVFQGFHGGGQGMAASAGLLVYGVATGLLHGWLSPAGVGVVIAVGVTAYLVARAPSLIAIVMLPVLVIEVVLGEAGWQFVAFMSAVAAHIWIVQMAAWRGWGRLRAAESVGGPAHN